MAFAGRVSTSKTHQTEGLGRPLRVAPRSEELGWKVQEKEGVKEGRGTGQQM